MTEDEIVRQHHQLNGHEFQQTPGDTGGLRSLACWSSWVAKNQTPLHNWTATTKMVTCSTLNLWAWLN